MSAMRKVIILSLREEMKQFLSYHRVNFTGIDEREYSWSLGARAPFAFGPVEKNGFGLRDVED
jgi:hypothetical protein